MTKNDSSQGLKPATDKALNLKRVVAIIVIGIAVCIGMYYFLGKLVEVLTIDQYEMEEVVNKEF